MADIKAEDLHSVDDSRVLAERHEAYLGSLSESIAKGLRGETVAPGMTPVVSPTAAIEAVVNNASLTKGMSADALSSLQSALEAQRASGADIVKDLTLTNPISTGLVAYDLEAPAKLLTPKPTPLRNKIVRKKGTGTAHRFKVISGFTGTGTGGVSNLHPGISDSTTTQFGSINYLRGPKISYAGYDKAVTYKQFSLSDAVPFSAQFQGAGFQDIRQLSQSSVLWSSMLMEEKMLLDGRGASGDGFSGALAAPTVTLTARSATGSEVALPNATYYVYATSDAGSFGESAASTVKSQATTSQVIDVTVTYVAGALGYKVYAGTTTGEANCKYQGRTATLTYTLQGTLATTTSAAPTVDTSYNSNGYDGMLPSILAGGTVNRINAAFSTSNPGTEFQSVFGTMWDAVKADPDEVLMNGLDRKQLSDAIKGNGNANYRLTISQDEIGGTSYGSVVTGLQNEVTGKSVLLTVHPWLAQGNCPVVSWTLPLPDSQVSEVWSVVNTQDYMGIEWPVTQLAYETSSYWNGTFVCYAPAWNGIVAGVKAV